MNRYRGHSGSPSCGKFYSKRKSGGAYSYRGHRKLGDIHCDLAETCNSGIIPTGKMLPSCNNNLNIYIILIYKFLINDRFRCGSVEPSLVVYRHTPALDILHQFTVANFIAWMIVEDERAQLDGAVLVVIGRAQDWSTEVEDQTRAEGRHHCRIKTEPLRSESFWIWIIGVRTEKASLREQPEKCVSCAFSQM